MKKESEDMEAIKILQKALNRLHLRYRKLKKYTEGRINLLESDVAHQKAEMEELRKTVNHYASGTSSRHIHQNPLSFPLSF